MIATERNFLICTCLLLASATASAADSAATLDVRSCKVDYPKSSLMNEEQGTTSINFLVSANGAVLESKLEKTSGFKNLDKAAISALSSCKFKPGTKDGKPEQGWTRIDYNWTLS